MRDPNVPESLEGWWILHRMFAFDRAILGRAYPKSGARNMPRTRPIWSSIYKRATMATSALRRSSATRAI